jgi:hypothetical protein
MADSTAIPMMDGWNGMELAFSFLVRGSAGLPAGMETIR